MPRPVGTERQKEFSAESLMRRPAEGRAAERTREVVCALLLHRARAGAHEAWAVSWSHAPKVGMCLVCVFVLLSSFTDVIVWFWFGVKSETVKILKNTQRSWSSAFQLGPLQFIVVDHGFIRGSRTQWVAKRLADNAQNDISWTGIVTDLDSLVYWI